MNLQVPKLCFVGRIKSVSRFHDEVSRFTSLLVADRDQYAYEKLFHIGCNAIRTRIPKRCLKPHSVAKAVFYANQRIRPDNLIRRCCLKLLNPAGEVQLWYRLALRPGDCRQSRRYARIKAAKVRRAIAQTKC